MNTRSLLQICVISFLLFALFGCDAFVRKFTRKPKKDSGERIEMVLEPEEYKAPPMTPEARYREYFLFWKSWHDELIVSLRPGANHKKQVHCASEAIKSLTGMRSLLKSEAQVRLDSHLNQLRGLEAAVRSDTYGTNSVSHRQKAESIKRRILRDFSYPKIKDQTA